MKTQLLVREVDEKIVNALIKQAAENGRSVEAEHRLILEQALHMPRKLSLADAILKIPPYGDDSDFERPFE